MTKKFDSWDEFLDWAESTSPTLELNEFRYGPTEPKLTPDLSDEFKEDWKELDDDTKKKVIKMIRTMIFSGEPLTDSIYDDHEITVGAQRGYRAARVPSEGDDLSPNP